MSCFPCPTEVSEGTPSSSRAAIDVIDTTPDLLNIQEIELCTYGSRNVPQAEKTESITRDLLG